MTKRLAAAVLCAIVNFFGSPAGGSASSSDGGGDDDGGIDYVELRRDRHASQGAADPLVAASRIVGGDVQHAWLIHHHSGPSAAAAVQRDDRYKHAALVTLSVDVAVLPWEPLLGRSLAFCRENEALKVTIETQGAAAPADVRTVAQQNGFVFAGSRCVDDVHVAEFYTDLYRRDRPARHDA
jgi:hypothetical protein